MHDTAFKEAYGRLNKAQKEAVDAIEGPVMVIAGPGTGKTQILTLRIANILEKTDTKPENILALTFTESGARAMRERLRGYIGSAAYRIVINTFHVFASGLIHAYPDAYERVVGGRPASDIEKVELLETILSESRVTLLRPIGNPLYYVSPVGSAIATMKQEYITPDDFSRIIGEQEKELSVTPKLHEKGAHKGKVRSEYHKKERDIEKNRELLLLYRTYEALLKERHLYDYEDMIAETVRALSTNEDMLRDLQETYQYILADEHQDVNGSQNKILELLASYHDSPNLFVVGDEKQAIFRFQGASLENFLYFEDRFAGTKTIALTENYRSGQTILDAAHSLIKVDEGPQKELRVPLIATKDIDAKASLRAFSHDAVEDDWVVRSIEALLEAGVAKNEVAIIVRTNREVESFAELLRGKNIPVRPSADSDILTHPITHSVRLLINATIRTEDERALFELLHASYWNIDGADLIKVLAAKRYQHPLRELLESEQMLAELGLKHPEAVTRVAAVLKAAQKMEGKEAPHRVLAYLVGESGFLDEVMHENAFEGVRVLRRLYDEVEGFVKREGIGSLRDVSTLLDRRAAHGLPLAAPYIDVHGEAVQVMTAHKAKGLEFEHVFVPHLTDRGWGGRKRAEAFVIPLTRHLTMDTFDPLDDERRLLYVAMTRAKVGLSMSYGEVNTEGRESVPSRLLTDIDTDYLEPVSTKDEEQQFSFDTVLKGERPKVLTRVLTPDMLSGLLKERGLSATALDNYLTSPWNYFYKNILRIPEVQPLYLLKGTAYHEALLSITTYHTKHHTVPSTTEIKQFLERELGKLPITKEEYVQLHEEGLLILTRYTEHLKDVLPLTTREEIPIEVQLATGDTTFPELKLTGKLDRLDFDNEGNVIRIVDYKTGKPKTKGYIEGTTKDSNGNYKRQLTFYALLLSLYEKEGYDCRTTLLSFVEADRKGEIKEFSYTITDDEIEALKKEIVRVGLEIVHGTFLHEPCDPKTSEYCHLVEQLVDRS